MNAAALLDDEPVDTSPPRLNAAELLAHRHARRSAVRALAGLARGRDDFELLAAMLDLDPADARTDLPPLVLTPVLPAPLPAVDRPDRRPPGLRFTATEQQQAPPRASRPVRPVRSARIRALPLPPPADGLCPAEDCSRPYRHRGIHAAPKPQKVRPPRPAPAQAARPARPTSPPRRPTAPVEQRPADGLCLLERCVRPWKHRGAHSQPFDAAAAVRRYQAGEGLFELAKALGVGANRVRAALADAGVPLRKRGQVLHRKPPAVLDADQCRALYAQGLTTAEVGRLIGVRPTRVADQLRADGLLRPPGQSGLPADGAR